MMVGGESSSISVSVSKVVITPLLGQITFVD